LQILTEEEQTIPCQGLLRSLLHGSAEAEEGKTTWHSVVWSVSRVDQTLFYFFIILIRSEEILIKTYFILPLHHLHSYLLIDD
jgi:hypothetical protein